MNKRLLVLAAGFRTSEDTNTTTTLRSRWGWTGTDVPAVGSFGLNLRRQ